MAVKMGRACGAKSLEEERRLLFEKAQLALAAKARLASVRSRAAGEDAERACDEAKEELARDLKAASTEVLADRATALVLLRANGKALQFCSRDFRNDPEMVLAACEEDGFSFEHASLEMKADREVVLQTVRRNGFALVCARHEFRGDREVVLAALQSEPLALQCATDELFDDQGLLLEALKCHTRRSILTGQGNVLSQLFARQFSDKELVLEAVRVDGSALASASIELRKDKDFVLEAMRKTPREDQRLCYEEAHASLRLTISFGELQGACNSALAREGDEAPVVTVSILPDSEPAPTGCQPETQSLTPSRCEVSLLSGASFICSLLGAAHGPWPSRRTTPLTVGQLAKRVKAQLQVHFQVEEPPARFIFVFTKHEVEGPDSSVLVNPWDWNRPVADFT